MTVYPERWDQDNETRLIGHLLKSVSSHKFRQEDSKYIYALADAISVGAMKHECRTVVECTGNDDSDGCKYVQVSCSDAYVNSVAEMVGFISPHII